MGGYPATLSRCRYFSISSMNFATVAMLAAITAILYILSSTFCTTLPFDNLIIPYSLLKMCNLTPYYVICEGFATIIKLRRNLLEVMILKILSPRMSSLNSSPCSTPSILPFFCTKNRRNPCGYGVCCIGDPGGIRTPDPRLRRPLLYPTELLNHIVKLVERAMGIEPTTSAWKAEVLPLNYTRK